MTVSAILRQKGSDVISVEPAESISAVAALLAEKRIGAVLVCDGSKLAGIISERDIVRGIAQEGPGVLDKPVTHLMTRNVQRCQPGDTVQRVMQLMTEGRFRHLPVMEDGSLVGFVSIGDVVRRRIDEVEREANEIRDYVHLAAG